MPQLLKPTTIRVRDRTKNAMLSLGEAHMDTFTAFQRNEDKHLFRGGSESVEEAVEAKTAAWGLDYAIMEILARDNGIKYVEIPTQKGVYRTRMDTLLGHKSFSREFGGHRPQVFLPLEYWTFNAR